MTTCPDENTLAAFAENKLTSRRRLAIIEHLTECAECRDVVLLVIALVTTLRDDDS